MKIWACDCEHEEIGQGSGTVKGYALVNECEPCRIKREAQAVEYAQRQAEEQRKALGKEEEYIALKDKVAELDLKTKAMEVQLKPVEEPIQ